MATNWAFAPVCGVDFWRVIVTSPEVLIFLFFMITDPKTVPAGRVGRIVFGLLVAVASTLLIAPADRTSSGPRSGCSPAWSSSARRGRSSIDSCPSRAPRPTTFGRFATGSLIGGDGRGRRPGRRPGRPDRGRGLRPRGRDRRRRDAGPRASWSPIRARCSTASRTRSTRPRSPPSRADVAGLGRRDRAGRSPRGSCVTLAENLELENQALLRTRREPSSPPSTTATGSTEMQGRLKDATATGRTVIDHYRFDVGARRRHRAVRRADGRQPRLRIAGHGHDRRPTTRAGALLGHAGRRRSSGRSPCGGRPAIAG